MMKKILFSLWGPELGCLMRQVQIAECLQKIDDVSFSFFCHPRHVDILKNHFGDDVSFCCYDDMIRIFYDSRFDLRPFQTIAHTSAFLSVGLMMEFFRFRRFVRDVEPSLVVNDFLPNVSLYSRVLGIPSIGVQNYVMPGFLSNRTFMDFLFWTGFYGSYNFHSHNLVETFYPEKLDSRPKFTWTSPVAKAVDKDRSLINRKLGVGANDKLVFLALGGASTNLGYLSEIHDLSPDYPDIRILLLPRNEAEAFSLPERYPNFVHTKEVVYDTYNYVGNSDVVISKCGFRTVAEALKNGAAFLPFNTPNHPEIYLNEKMLLDYGFACSSINRSDEPHVFFDKIACSLDHKGAGLSSSVSYDGHREMSEFIKDCPQRVLEKAG